MRRKLLERVNRCDEQRQDGVTRRDFLKAVGSGVVGAAALAQGGLSYAPRAQAQSGNFFFIRMFPDLPQFAGQGQAVVNALTVLGQTNGPLDAMDNSAAPKNPDNPTLPAGATFMGQFMDHDMTFDTGSTLGMATVPRQNVNIRVAAFDLDSLYGRGLSGDPQLYNPGNLAKLKIESGGLFEDVPRSPGNGAIISDPRNDENMIVSGLHAAFILFHNRAVDVVSAQQPTLTLEQKFLEARRLTTWHYQWLIVHEFLPMFIGQAMVDNILTFGRQFYLPPQDNLLIPVEFQAAVYRFGHSMVRPGYRANNTGNAGALFAAGIFDPAEIGKPDPNALHGGARARRRFIGWRGFFDFGDGLVQNNKRMDTKLSTPLFNLPPAGPQGAIAGLGGPTSLAQRNLLRHLTWRLPSGQAIAQAMNVAPLTPAQLSELASIHPNFPSSTPLWYYVLKEAEVTQTTAINVPPSTGATTGGGLRLGPVGGRITGEVILGLLQLDPTSYFSQPGWIPTLQNPTTSFRMVDFLTFAFNGNVANR